MFGPRSTAAELHTVRGTDVFYGVIRRCVHLLLQPDGGHFFLVLAALPRAHPGGEPCMLYTPYLLVQVAGTGSRYRKQETQAGVEHRTTCNFQMADCMWYQQVSGTHSIWVTGWHYRLQCIFLSTGRKTLRKSSVPTLHTIPVRNSSHSFHARVHGDLCVSIRLAFPYECGSASGGRQQQIGTSTHMSNPAISRSVSS